MSSLEVAEEVRCAGKRLALLSHDDGGVDGNELALNLVGWRHRWRLEGSEQ
jgi:hypothetical protein